ncbi:MAG TPA: polyprenyl synthetase family protein [Parvibaculum sp.]|uniref:polyprenyl synthetase family protein n=1 Tax=Parvibaculum sp. TaxID=2024848 RepID=UPI002BE7EFC8|nr:polyprenyl synthetase family protein [Parvibaculum sp.]HMM13220.1 polyprenyl synthetase family protein [Parvibaculum sp.]
MGVVVPLEDERGRSQNAVAQLQALVRDDMEDVNEFIRERMSSDVPMIPELASHLINSGGKRLRPMLTIAASRLCGYTGGDHIKLAASVEFLHTATLLHDDVVDESDLRRGQKTARMVWGNQASVLVGDFLLGRAFRLMVETRSLRALEIIANAASIIAEGEVMQLAAAKDTGTTEDAYMRVIAAKTAALFAAATEVGAVIADRSAGEAAALESYGRNLGIAFQLVDDALDYGGRAASLGKNVGDDFREGKITLPVVLAFRRGGTEERAFWERTLTRGDRREGDLDHAKELMTKHGAIEDTIARARHYGSIAKDALAIFPDDPYRQALIDLVDFCISRTY